MSLEKLAPLRHHTGGRAGLLPPSAPSPAAWPAGRWPPAPRTPRASHWGSCCPGWAPSRSSSPRLPHAETCCLCRERLGVFRGLKDKTMETEAGGTREAGEVYQTLPAPNGGDPRHWEAPLHFAVLTPTRPRAGCWLAESWRGPETLFSPGRNSDFPKRETPTGQSGDKLKLFILLNKLNKF